VDEDGLCQRVCHILSQFLCRIGLDYSPVPASGYSIPDKASKKGLQILKHGKQWQKIILAPHIYVGREATEAT
jgi:hypothetical protein